MAHLTLVVDFTIGEDDEEDTFKLGGSVKKEAAPEIIEAWLRSQMGAGADSSEANCKNTYRIEINWDPTNDAFVCHSDCGTRVFAMVSYSSCSRN